MVENISRIYKFIIYKKAINDLTYKKIWQETIKKELQNLKNHHTCKYIKLPLSYKIINLK